MIWIVGTDNLNRETVADNLLLVVPEQERVKAQEFCDWINTFSCSDYGGTFYKLKPAGSKLSRGMEDLV